MTVSHVVFDIGRVLVHWDPELPYRRLIPDEAERRRFLDEICNHAWIVEQDRGRAWADAEAELVARHPQHADLIRAFRRHWREMVPHAYPETVAIFRRLIANGVDVTLLTNWAADTYEEASPDFEFLREARGVTVSGRVRLIKPDIAIYDHHARTFGLDPARTLFIDDSPANVEGAREAGWQSVLFVSPERLEQDLAAFGLL
ncbi:HAD family phosphatase [Aureimonas sp. AU4]|uniref:HAD family hydrolase n=1 Tax=Aureimonas sp. AU4 TaxID=1638163 RepID=UPI000783AFB8|nr:HAD family phosphatase [Aureimonas sp. AU4]